MSVETPPDESGWELLLQFPDQSPSFARGFEAGTLWHSLFIEVGPTSRYIDPANREMVTRMCGRLGWSVEFEETEQPHLVLAKMERSRKPSLTLIPGGAA